MYTSNDLTRDLINLGLKRTDTVLIHSSCKSVGDVEGRADTILDVFMDYFGQSGLVVFPTLTWSKVNDKQPYFNVKETPSCVGILPELFRQRPNVIRSLHPTHSVAAFGPKAKEFTQGNEKLSTPCGVNSPWWRLMEYSGKILFIGTKDISCNTFCHGVDEWTNEPEILTSEAQHLFVIDENGNTIECPSYRHNKPRNAVFGSYEELFKSHNAITYGKFGDANCYLLDSRLIAQALGVKVPAVKE
jgi:aminoglycoside 3-N-acetyltransferase